MEALNSFNYLGNLMRGYADPTDSRPDSGPDSGPDARTMPTPALIARAFELSALGSDSPARWDCVHTLCRRGEAEIFQVARRWAATVPSQRRLGADVLAKLGPLAISGADRARPFTEPTVPILERLLDDADAQVVAAAIYALHHHHAREPVTRRMALAGHASRQVRKAVAVALGGATGPAAVTTLVTLSGDDAEDVRDWATFGLGTMCDLDTPEIRQALFVRLTDRHFETRAEAMAGLARRGDLRAVPTIAESLAAQWVDALAVEAAGEIAAADLVRPLQALLAWWDLDTELLDAALSRCHGVASPVEDWRWHNVADDPDG